MKINDVHSRYNFMNFFSLNKVRNLNPKGIMIVLTLVSFL